uniref:DUF6824 domain-containing protein n=1 Tax=Entomoneis paludosa TaxID=265537 RepID=A0A7S2VHA2_9STRA|mmetsp:Transcript_19/g.51  ORF Transcript_19/g.51 Transcript_19/m.51 type:complete len:475 (+) Transcript_19:92-1516(+)
MQSPSIRLGSNVSQPPLASSDDKGSRHGEERLVSRRSSAGTSSASSPVHPITSNQEVGPNDVLCGRNKDSFNHTGNKRFRDAITFSVEHYNMAQTKAGKTKVIYSIMESIRAKGGRFLKTDDWSGQWLELSDQQAKEKIAHAIRDMEGRRYGRKPVASTQGSLKKSRSQTTLGSATSNRTATRLLSTMDAVSNSATRSLPGDFYPGNPLSPGGVFGAMSTQDFYDKLDAATRQLSMTLEQQQQEQQMDTSTSASQQHALRRRQLAFLSGGTSSLISSAHDDGGLTTVSLQMPVLSPANQQHPHPFGGSSNNNGNLPLSAQVLLEPMAFPESLADSGLQPIANDKVNVASSPSSVLLENASSVNRLNLSRGIAEPPATSHQQQPKAHFSSCPLPQLKREMSSLASTAQLDGPGSTQRSLSVNEIDNANRRASTNTANPPTFLQVDPFLDTINQVLGPLQAEDSLNDPMALLDGES